MILENTIELVVSCETVHWGPGRYLLSDRGQGALHGNALSVKVSRKGVNSGVVGINALKEAGKGR